MKVSPFRYHVATLFQPYYEGDADGDGEGGDGGGEGGSWDGKFTPEQQKAVDKIINERFKKERTEKEKLLGQLNTLKESAGLTAKERDDLMSQIDVLETSMLTKDEQAAKQKTELEKKHQQQLTKATEETSLWQKRFTDSLIERALTDAAVSTDAANPTQLRLMFRGSTRLVEGKDEATGKPNGSFVPHMSFIGLNEDNEQVSMELPVDEAIKKLKDDGLNANLFKHGATGGTGHPPSKGQGGSRDPSAMPRPEDFKTDAEYGKAYQDWRDSYNLDGTARKK